VGCVVVGEAESPVGGLERFEALRPRLVTLDIVMPEIDGMTAIELLRRIKRRDHDSDGTRLFEAGRDRLPGKAVH